jgi:thioredoxin-dependent peroxiredoxin
MLKIGRKAPLFALLDQDNTEQKLKSYLGKWVVLYFYPKDDTPGCTTEACTISDIYKDFKRMGVTVMGVSKDSVKSHKKFAEKYSLPFTLLADPTMEMMGKYGAAVEKQMYGKTVRGTNRITYLIAPDGKIAKVYPNVDPATHALELLAELKQIKKEEKKTAKLAIPE